ncbi:MAG: NAD(P)H-hydrate dehydratase [Burkholderiales bacterium]|nr:NAD(P)H-hydrate dehydratase [Burkholderiales bacterium]
MQRITATTAHSLHGIAATRFVEQQAAATLAPHTLMRRAGLATANLAQALAPHARSIWVACGPGNNGGDGLETALHLHQRGYHAVVTWLGESAKVSADAHDAWQRASQAGVRFAAEPPTHADLCIDALLGIGSTRAPQGRMAHWVQHMNHCGATVLAVDVPTGLHAETGALTQSRTEPASHTRIVVRAHHTLSLLTLKPGLFTGHGRDFVGQVWLDPLGVDVAENSADATLAGPPPRRAHGHASHKGTRGDVAVIGGAPGMTGAALLAASAALHAGAGRVIVSLLDDHPIGVDPLQPELMMRPYRQLNTEALTVVCGCGGGEAIASILGEVMMNAPRLVLDADALNAISADARLAAVLIQRGTKQATVLTPHPLEAARLLGCGTADIQANRLLAAQELADRLRCTVVLKGSGTVTAAPGQHPVINPTGNGKLATGGTGDVLAGLLGTRLASGMNPYEAAWTAVYQHAELADRWPNEAALTAGALAKALS